MTQAITATPAATPRHGSDTRLFLRMLKEARAYVPHLVAIFLLSLLAAPLALLVPLPIQIAVDSVIGSEPPPAFLQPMLPDSRGGLLLAVVAMLVTFTLLQQAEGFASWLLQLYTGERLSLDFRARLFERAQRLSLRYHDKAGTADCLYRIQYDAPAVQYVVVSGLIPIITAALTVLAMLLVMVQISPLLAAVAAGVAPLLLLLTEWYRRRIRVRWTDVKQRESRALGVVQEVMSALRVVKAFGQESRERDRFAGVAGGVVRAQIRVILAETGFGLSVAAAMAGGTAVILYLGVVRVQSGQITLGQLLLVMAYLAQFYKPLETISRKIASLQSSMAGAERAFQLLDHPDEVPEPPPGQALPLVRARGRVTFEGVTYGYDQATTVLRDVWLDVPAGTRVGIVGRTGSGKTTLVNLLTRLHDPVAGRILLDGVDLRRHRLRDLREQFSIVLQEPVLFSTSIAENIAYGRPGASRNEVAAAAEAAFAHDFICRLPAGYDTVLGERGMTLSGGERQRISLARAFLKDAPILILDEPTSAVDVQSEATIIDAMERLMVSRTTFMIAHRLATLGGCDLIVRIDAGRAEVRPPHEDAAQPVLTGAAP